ncbi:MAG: DUF2270 domain-containing protein [bacterium]|nr:DUF2270 domain-containing protein [bacterium]
MDDAHSQAPQRSPENFEDYPLTRQEYISVMVHFYRGEVNRSTAWRQRLDATTNWSVLTMAGMLSFAFATPNNPHILLLLSNLVILSYLIVEGRRYRYFEVYRARVRMLEENFLIPVITRQLESPMVTWREMVAMDLDLPKYKTTLLEAVGFRLWRNYVHIFLIILGAWFIKLVIHPEPMSSVSQLWERIAVAWIPAWAVVGGGVAFYVSLLIVMYVARHIHGGEPEDEIAGLERNLEHWKL